MRHSGFLDALIAKQARGEPVPLLDERPQLTDEQAYYFEAFAALNTCRGPAAHGIGNIPWLAAMAYCNERGVTDQDDRADLWAYISAMDSVMVAHVQQKLKEGIEDQARKR